MTTFEIVVAVHRIAVLLSLARRRRTRTAFLAFSAAALITLLGVELT